MKNNNIFFYFIKFKNAKWPPSDLTPWTLTLGVSIRCIFQLVQPMTKTKNAALCTGNDSQYKSKEARLSKIWFENDKVHVL